MARELAKRSHDPTYQVGALVVTRENTQVLSLGYNGNAPGLPHERESMSPGESGFIHAEVNALIKMDFNHPAKKVMYVTLSPCRMCAKLIMAANISEVVYADQYRDLDGIRLLDREGVKVRQFRPEVEGEPVRICVHCKSFPAVRGGRFCSVLCAAGHEPEEITPENHPIRVVTKTPVVEKKNPDVMPCANCKRDCKVGHRYVTTAGKAYCDMECAEEDGEDWAQK